jgi:hypothetical protein
MNIPGFTAEASLYKVKAHYQTTSIAGQAGEIGEGVRLAVRLPYAKCYSECMGSCDPGWTPNCRGACSCHCSGGHNCPPFG